MSSGSSMPAFPGPQVTVHEACKIYTIFMIFTSIPVLQHSKLHLKIKLQHVKVQNSMNLDKGRFSGQMSLSQVCPLLEGPLYYCSKMVTTTARVRGGPENL